MRLQENGTPPGLLREWRGDRRWSSDGGYSLATILIVWVDLRSRPGDGTPVRVVAGLLRRDGQLLLCHRTPDRPNYPDVWDLPGGHIESYETMAGALVRELDEELAIRIETPDQPPWETVQADGFELNVFMIGRWTGEPRNAAADEHDEIRWVGAEDIAQLDLAHPYYLQLLRRALE